MSAGRIGALRRAVAALGALCLVAAGPAVAQQDDGSDQLLPRQVTFPATGEEILLTADEVTYDDGLGVVVASGNVEVSQGERVLIADQLSYNTRDGVVAASGNVALVEPTGEVMFSDYVELSDQLREGVIRDIRILLSDDSRMAGSGARRTGGNRTELRNAVFSPCKLCEEDPTRAPLWQIKADRVVHDAEDQQVRYYNPRLEFYGVPVLYSPYLQHSDPTVKRETGLLAPTFRTDENLGFQVTTPVYWAIDESKDVTFLPFFATKENPGLGLEYRQAFTSGYLDFFGSATVADRQEENLETGFQVTQKDRFRANVDAEGRFDITEDWRWGFDVERVTDRTYLKRYGFNAKEILTTNMFVEGFHDRNYASANFWEFQGLRQIDKGQSAFTPMILPEIDWNWTTEAFSFGGRFDTQVNLFNLRRKSGPTQQRLVVDSDFVFPWVSPFGDSYTVTAGLRGDVYYVHDVPRDDVPSSERSGITGRFVPRLSLEWKYPFVQRNESFQQTFEPIVLATYTPNGNNPNRIVNEDSQDVIWDDTQLLSLDRFTGFDRVDSGGRVTYGAKWGIVTNGGRYVSTFVGQAYNINTNRNFQLGSGIENNTSDIVGRIDVVPHDFVDINYRFRLARGTFEERRHEAQLAVGAPIFRVSGQYLLDRDTEGEFGVREEVSGRIDSQVSDNWRVNARLRRNLEEFGWINYGAGFTYQDECFAWQLDWTRNFTSDEDFDSSDVLFTRLVFKYLGEVSF